MNRRRLTLHCLSGSAVIAGAWPWLAEAHHGWSSFDQNRPLYLEGVARNVRWRNPHVEMALDVRPNVALPTDLSQRRLPEQSVRVDGPALLARAQLPTRRDPRWEVELAPLSRMNQWRVPEIKDGTALALLGFTFTEERGEPILRAEYLFLGDQVFGLRSAPLT
jgi:hypothetical protein